MIFVTVGTIRFDELIQVMDEAAARGDVSDVLLQIGYGGKYVPKHCEYFRGAPGLDAYYRRAELVVGHGGTGTTLELLERGQRFISVCNPNMIDNHQHEFLEALESKGLISYCRSLARLPQVIRESLASDPPKPLGSAYFFRSVCSDLESL